MEIRSKITAHSGTDKLQAHRHAGAYVALVLEGGYSEMSADGAWSLEPGDVVVHPPHHLHANSFKGKTRVLNLYIPEAGDQADEFQSYSVIRHIQADEFLRVSYDVATLRTALHNGETLERKEPQDWVDAMARDLAADSSVRIAELARHYSVTPEHAARRFRRRYFMTPSTFRTEQRFQHALDLLRRAQHSLSEIAQIAGYADQPHFCRNCRQITGASPARLRRRLS